MHKINVIKIYLCYCFPIDFKSQAHIQQINRSLHRRKLASFNSVKDAFKMHLRFCFVQLHLLEHFSCICIE